MKHTEINAACKKFISKAIQLLTLIKGLQNDEISTAHSQKDYSTINFRSVIENHNFSVVFTAK
jgi:hypothetical protein